MRSKAPDALRWPAVAKVRQELFATLSKSDFRLTHVLQSVPGFTGFITSAAAERLRRHPSIVAVEPDSPGHAHLGPGMTLIGADVLHSTLGITGQGIIAAVLDTGIATADSDFAGKIVAQTCSTSNDCPPNHTATGTSAEDDNDHGSNVAGILASKGAVSDPGVASGASLAIAKVLAADESGYVSDSIVGLDWVLNNLSTTPVRVVNMSLGTNALYTGNCDSSQPTMASATTQLQAKGVIITASAGNQGSSSSIASPACNTGVIAVGAVYDSNRGREPSTGTWNSFFGGSWPACFDATTSSSTVTCFTNSDSRLDLLAPGVVITSSAPNNGLTSYYGTSQASPMVAGTITAMLQCSPTQTTTSALGVLKSTGTLVTDTRNGLTFPRISASAAVSRHVPAWGRPMARRVRGPISATRMPASRACVSVRPSPARRWIHATRWGPAMLRRASARIPAPRMERPARTGTPALRTTPARTAPAPAAVS